VILDLPNADITEQVWADQGGLTLEQMHMINAALPTSGDTATVNSQSWTLHPKPLPRNPSSQTESLDPASSTCLSQTRLVLPGIAVASTIDLPGWLTGVTDYSMAAGARLEANEQGFARDPRHGSRGRHQQRDQHQLPRQQQHHHPLRRESPANPIVLNPKP